MRFSVPRIMHHFVQLVFPSVCPGCGRHLLSSEKAICRICQTELPFTHFDMYDNPLADKLRAIEPVSGIFPLCYFNTGTALQTLIHQLKYRRRKDIGYYLGSVLGEHLQQQLTPHFKAVIPVPLHKKRLLWRGFNQSAVIANGVASKLHLPVLSGQVLVRSKNTATQTHKSRNERFENVKNAFTVNIGVMPENVILVDDVITTGATALSCSNALLSAGCKQVILASIAFADDL